MGLHREIARIGLARFIFGWVTFLLAVGSVVWVFRAYGRPGVFQWVLGSVPTSCLVLILVGIRFRAFRWMIWAFVPMIVLILITSPIWWGVFDLGMPALVGLIASALGLSSMLDSLQRIQDRQRGTGQ